MLRHGTDDARRAFGTQGQAAFRLDGAAVDEAFEVLAGNGGEHLLRHDVGRFADAAHEQVGLLEDGRFDGNVPVPAEHRERRFLEVEPECRLVGQEVPRSFSSLHSHRVSPASFVSS